MYKTGIPTEIQEDFTGDWSQVLTMITQIPTIFSIKGTKNKIKLIKQEQIWTAFFGGYNKRDEPFEIENLKLDFENKEIPKNCRHLKLAFLDILKGFD